MTHKQKDYDVCKNTNIKLILKYRTQRPTQKDELYYKTDKIKIKRWFKKYQIYGFSVPSRTEYFC